MNVKRVTLNGKTTISFPHKSPKWLVKNFSEADITVSFEENAAEDEVITIASQMGQVIVENENATVYKYVHDTIYITGSGIVEVQQLCYR